MITHKSEFHRLKVWVERNDKINHLESDKFNYQFLDSSSESNWLAVWVEQNDSHKLVTYTRLDLRVCQLLLTMEIATMMAPSRLTQLLMDHHLMMTKRSMILLRVSFMRFSFSFAITRWWKYWQTGCCCFTLLP